jgi:hypothetical protein
MMEELSSSETSVLTRATRRNIPLPWKPQILHELRCLQLLQEKKSTGLVDLSPVYSHNRVAVIIREAYKSFRTWNKGDWSTVVTCLLELFLGIAERKGACPTADRNPSQVAAIRCVTEWWISRILLVSLTNYGRYSRDSAPLFELQVILTSCNLNCSLSFCTNLFEF